MTPSEQAAFDALVAELDGALARLGEPSVEENSAFSIEPDWFDVLLCVIAKRGDAAELRFMLDGDWIRVDIAGLAECLEIPLPGNASRGARKAPPMSETLDRLMTSRVTVAYRRYQTSLILTDVAGRVWCRNRYFGAAMLPPGFVRAQPREFPALVCRRR